MKKITFLLILLTVSLGYSQVLVDFEGGAYGGTFTYSPEDGDCPGSDTGVFAQQPNPVPTGNPSATAAEIITDTAGQPWQNAQLFLAAGDEIDLTGTTKTVSVLVYSTTATDILAKVVDGPSGGGATGSEVATDASHGGTGWETLSFDFSIPLDCGPNYCGPAFEVYSRILFFPLWNEGGAGFSGGTYCDTPEPLQSIWIDDITNTGTLGVNDFNLENVSVSPNPSRDIWNIKSNKFVINNVQVFDILGKQVMTLEPRSNDVTIDASNLLKGLYFAKMTTDLGSNSIKLIKN